MVVSFLRDYVCHRLFARAKLVYRKQTILGEHIWKVWMAQGFPGGRFEWEAGGIGKGGGGRLRELPRS